MGEFVGPNGRKYVERDGLIYCDRRNCPGSSGLRCQRTNVPICMQCAVQTPVGYISKDAAKIQANKYYNIANTDYAIAGVVAFFTTLIGGLPIAFIVSGFGFFAFFLAFLIGVPLGGVVSEVVRRAIGNRRGRYTGRVVGGAMMLAIGILFVFTGFSFIVLLLGGVAASAAISRFEIALRA